MPKFCANCGSKLGDDGLCPKCGKKPEQRNNPSNQRNEQNINPPIKNAQSMNPVNAGNGYTNAHNPGAPV